MVFSFHAGAVEFTISGNQYYQRHDPGKTLSTKTRSDAWPQKHAWVNRLVSKMSSTAVCHWNTVVLWWGFFSLRTGTHTHTPVCTTFTLNFISTCRPETIWTYCTLSVCTYLYQPITCYVSLNDAWASQLGFCLDELMFLEFIFRSKLWQTQNFHPWARWRIMKVTGHGNSLFSILFFYIRALTRFFRFIRCTWLLN